MSDLVRQKLTAVLMPHGEPSMVRIVKRQVGSDFLRVELPLSVGVRRTIRAMEQRERTRVRFRMVKGRAKRTRPKVADG